MMPKIMTPNKTVCVDFDGTILDFYGGLKIRLAEMGHTFYPERCIDYHFNGDIGCDKELIYGLFKDEELYHKLPFLEGAEKAVALLLEQNRTVYGYTSSVDSKPIFDQRENLVQKMNMIPKVFIGNKPVMDADALFDDCLGVHRCWVEAGSKAKLYLINQPHNRMTEANKNDPIWKHVIRCNSLYEAVLKYLEDTQNQ